MRQEADDGGAALQLGLQLRNQRQRLGVRIVEVEDDQPWPVFFLAAYKAGDRFLVVLDECNLDAKLARRFLNLRDEEEVFDEEKDLCGCVFRDRNGAALRVVDGLGVALVAASAAVASALVVAVAVRVDGGWRSFGEVAVDDAVAVIHGADEAAWTALLLAA